MKITKELRQHMVEKFALEDDASDEEVRAGVKQALLSGALKREDVDALVATSPNEERIKSLVGDAVESAMGGIESKLGEMVSSTLAKHLAPGTGEGNGDGGESVKTNKALNDDGTPSDGGTKTPEGGDEATSTGKAFAGGTQTDTTSTTSSGYDNVRVKSVVERFSHTPTAATWDKQTANQYMNKGFAGRSVNSHMSGVGLGGIEVEMATERSKAITGAWFKFLINKQCKIEGREVPYAFKMNEQDHQLVQYAAHESRFVGPVGYQGTPAKNYSDVDADTDGAMHWFGGERTKDLSNADFMVKALLDDTTSGGLEAVPIEFDANFILTPLLTGELFPLVDVVNVTRRRIEGAKIGNPDVTWGTAEGTDISLYDTTSYISAFDNTIWPVTGAMELGRDFQSDSPLDIGQIVTQRYGQAFLKEMDTVIANGNGTNRPEGLFQASGVSTVSNAGGAGAAPQAADYENLAFGVNKEFLQEAGMPPNSRAIFLGTQTSYQRSRSIKVGSSDARRLFGSNNQHNYRLQEFKYAINSSAGNAVIGFFCLNRYRLYRRQGLEVRIVNDDRKSVRSNTELVVVRARFGGALDHASAGVKITDAQA